MVEHKTRQSQSHRIGAARRGRVTARREGESPKNLKRSEEDQQEQEQERFLEPNSSATRNAMNRNIHTGGSAVPNPGRFHQTTSRSTTNTRASVSPPAPAPARAPAPTPARPSQKKRTTQTNEKITLQTGG